MKNKINLSIYLIFFTSILVSISCNKNEDEKILSHEDLVALLTELHCADAIITQNGLTGVKLKDSIPAYYSYILKKHHTSIQGFNTSIEYYSEDVHEMLSIYDEVIANITNKIPKKLSDKSIYKIFDLALEEATVKSNPDKWFGKGGRELWNKNKSTSIIGYDSLNKLDYTGKLKYHSLLMLKASIIVYPDDSSKNLRMVLKINYSDKTSDIKEKLLNDKNRAWKDYQLFIKSDSTKKTESFESFVLQFDSLTGKRHISVNNVSLRQYGPGRDTTDLIIKENQNKPPAIEKNKKIKNQKFNLLRKQKVPN